jgi:capsid protein
MSLFEPLARATNRVASYFGYDAAESTPRRGTRSVRLMHEDDELPEGKRRNVVSNARDLNRNFAIAAWAIRKHLDFVSSFTFQMKTPDRALNTTIEGLMQEWSHPDNCDAAGRHSFRRMIRIAEASRCLDGDIFPVKLRTGHLQMIEGDRVRNPIGANLQFDRKSLKHGVRLDAAGRALGFAVHTRTDSGGFQFERMVARENCLQFGFFNRIDQVRGISPVVAALNTYTDLYEGFDYALAKAKVAQLFGLVFYRDAVDPPAPTEESEESTEDKPKYEVDFGKGPVVLDLDAGDKAEFLENKTPSNEFREFTQVMTSIALKSLDLPFSFYDEAYTNFFGSRAALILYLQSCKAKREDLREMLREITIWKLTQFVLSGLLVLPGNMTIADLSFEWIHDGVPWWDPSKDINADVAAISAGLRTRSEIRKERYGDDWTDVIDKLAEEEAYILEKKVTITAAGPGIYNPAPVVKDDEEQQSAKGAQHAA